MHVKKSKYVPKSKMSVVDGFIYDVDYAIFITDFEPGWYSLYKTANGNYFVTSNKSEYPIMDWFFRNDMSNGFPKDINPLTKEQVIELLNRYKMFDILFQEFPKLQRA